MHIGRADPFPDIAFLFDICDHDMAGYIADLKVDMTAEAPLSWIQFVCSFAINTPVKLYTLVRTAAFYHPFEIEGVTENYFYLNDTICRQPLNKLHLLQTASSKQTTLLPSSRNRWLPGKHRSNRCTTC